MPSIPLLPEVSEPDEPLPEVPVLESGAAVLEEPGPANGVTPEESVPEAPEVPLEPEVVLEVSAPDEVPLEPEVLLEISVPDEVEPDPEESPLIEPVELPELLDPEVPDVS
ncbi:hypothetical protein Q8A64_15580 [Oxalobacteraceae bacterium R-40]|uniref:Uncharacterized protein n=1 Tax=Keguizhuia sedimenti TaxID=3064264 RepID=A0ABU1BSK1_9BURK|nr:hypothetical protein [Oxalobacteraceae bacterium R-40]